MFELISYPNGRDYEQETDVRLWQPNKPDTWRFPATPGPAPVETPTIVPGGPPAGSGIEHIGLCVPDLDEAIDWFCNVIGCEYMYRQGPATDDSTGDDNMFTKYVGLHPRTRADIAMLRCGNGPNLELFQFDAPDQNRRMPRFSDAGGAHLAFYVDDVETGYAYLRAQQGIDTFGGISWLHRGPRPRGIREPALP